MRIERLREELEVLNKLNGMNYKVVSVEEDGRKGTACLMKEDGTLDETQAVVITEGNALAFRVEKDPKPYDVPKAYRVDNGTLLKGEANACKQGQLKIHSILAAIRGMLVLAMEPAEQKDGFVDLYLYDTVRDRFRKITGRPMPVPALVGYDTNQETAIMAYCAVSEKEEKDVDGKSVKKVSVNSRVFRVCKDGITYSDLSAAMPVTVKDIQILNEGGFHVLVPSNEEVKDGAVIPNKECKWYLLDEDLSVETSFGMDGNVKASWSPYYKCFTVKGDGALFIANQDDGIMIRDSKVNGLEDCNVLIDMTRENRILKLAFCNEDYKIRTIVSEKTMDRGYLVSLQ